MRDINDIAKQILYNGYIRSKQTHLYVLVGNSVQQQQSLYDWYVKLHVCENLREDVVCETCAMCQTVNHHNFVNSIVIKRQENKKSVGMDDMKQLQDVFQVTAHADGIRFFCVEDADLLTTQAANSILKFLEEPAGSTIGFLFVKNEQKILPTIRSRSQVLRLKENVLDEDIQKKIEKQLATPSLQASAIFLLTAGHDMKLVLKQTKPLYEKIESYCIKIANGSPLIVAQTELETIAIKTKTTTMVLELLTYIIGEQLKYRNQFEGAPPKVPVYLEKNGAKIYIAAQHALQMKRYNMGGAMVLTYFSLELGQLL